MGSGRRIPGLLMAAVAAVPVNGLAGVNRYYVGNGGNWNTPASWSATSGGAPGASVPANGDTAWVTGSIGVSVPFDGNYSSPGLVPLYVDGSGGATITLCQTSAQNSMCARPEYIGSSGSAVYIHSGGTHSTGTPSAASDLYLGYNSSGSGTYSLSGTGSLSVGSQEYIGYHGTGVFNQSGGTHSLSSSGSLYLGMYSGSSGTYNLTAGNLSSNDATVGWGGTGVFNHSGGTHHVRALLSLGSGSGSGSYSLSGTGTLSVEFGERVGRSGRGTFTQSGGTHSITYFLEVGLGPASNGTYDLSGGVLTVPTLTNKRTFNYRGGTLNVQTLEVLEGGQMNVAAGGDKTLRIKSLTVDEPSGSKLDLNNNDLVVDYSATPLSSPFTTIYQYVQHGRKRLKNGEAPATSGIISTTAYNNTVGAGTLLVVLDNALVGATEFPAGSGQNIALNSVIGKYTWVGDVNLDGKVTGDDYAIADVNLGKTFELGWSWKKGDVNGDGKVTGDDYAVMDVNLGQGVGNPLAPVAAASVESGGHIGPPLQAVPEPSMWWAVGFGAWGATAGRRKARRTRTVAEPRKSARVA